MGLFQNLIVSFTLLGLSLLSLEACDLLPEGNESVSCFHMNSVPHIRNSSSQFGGLIEGASVAPDGSIFATNWDNQIHQLGQAFPTQEILYSDPSTNSYVNGIRFLSNTTAYVADVVNHRVIQLTLAKVNSSWTVTGNSTFCANQSMLQPNDLTVSSNGVVFTSGMNWVSDTDDQDGDIWSCSDGVASRLEVMGRTNGIDLSPDESALYVSESYNVAGIPTEQKIWKYLVNGTQIANKTIFADFEVLNETVSHDIDGIKTDTQGNLFVTRYGGSRVVVLNPDGKIIGRIAVSFNNPTNLEFGGPNGTTLFIVGQCFDQGTPTGRGCVDSIEMRHAGRSWTMLNA